jgi:hypothetical protein
MEYMGKKGVKPKGAKGRHKRKGKTNPHNHNKRFNTKP